MKLTKYLTTSLLVATFIGGPLLAGAADAKPEEKLKPYPLTTCVVSGDKLGEMGEPYLYKYKDREIKFCCKNCVKDFNKDPKKYVKKLEEAEAKAKK
jgi:YHS domain-containing protein